MKKKLLIIIPGTINAERVMKTAPTSMLTKSNKLFIQIYSKWNYHWHVIPKNLPFCWNILTMTECPCKNNSIGCNTLAKKYCDGLTKIYRNGSNVPFVRVALWQMIINAKRAVVNLDFARLLAVIYLRFPWSKASIILISIGIVSVCLF